MPRIETPRRGPAMAVAIRLRFPGGTQEQYQAVHDTVNAGSPLGERGFPSPPGREHFTVHNLEQHGDCLRD
jgi:hypothetical protein